MADSTGAGTSGSTAAVGTVVMEAVAVGALVSTTAAVERGRSGASAGSSGSAVGGAVLGGGISTTGATSISDALPFPIQTAWRRTWPSAACGSPEARAKSFASMPFGNWTR